MSSNSAASRGREPPGGEQQPGTHASGSPGNVTRAPWSLAARLTAWYAATAFLVVLVATGFLYRALASNLESEDEQYLADKVRGLRVALRLSPHNLSALAEEARWAARQPVSLSLRVLDADGATLLETPGLSERLPPGRFPPPVGEQDSPGRGNEIDLP